MIIVTGATGQLGSLIVERLLAGMPASALGASARDPSKAQSLAERGVRIRHGDFENPSSLAHAFEGVTQLLLVSSNASSHGGDPVAQHRAAISAAKQAGARRIVYTSHMGASERSKFAPMLDHAVTEGMLAEAGVPFTALRNGFYAESALMMMGEFAMTGEVAGPADGKVAWTTHADLAAAAAAVLAQEGRFNGPTPPLTGDKALDLQDLASIAGELLGMPVERRIITDGEFRDATIERGTPAPYANVLLGIHRASREGEFSVVDPTLSKLIGRPATSMRDVLADRLRP